MNTKYPISFIFPVYNEEANIYNMVKSLVDFLQTQDVIKEYEIIIVEDGSMDNTAKVVRELQDTVANLKVVAHTKNLGYGKALMSGVQASQYRLVFFMDADGQFNIRDIGKIFPYLEDFDIIAAYRNKRADTLYRIILARVYTYIVFLLFGLKLKDINCGFKLFKKEILTRKNIYSKAGVFYTEILLRAKNEGYVIKEIPVDHFPRLEGKQTGASPKVIFNAITDLLKLKYSLTRDTLKNFLKGA